MTQPTRNCPYRQTLVLLIATCWVLLTHPCSLKLCTFPFCSTEWNRCCFWNNLEFDPIDFLKEIICKFQYSISDKVAGDESWPKHAAMQKWCAESVPLGLLKGRKSESTSLPHLSIQVGARRTATPPTKKTRSHSGPPRFSLVSSRPENFP